MEVDLATFVEGTRDFIEKKDILREIKEKQKTIINKINKMSVKQLVVRFEEIKNDKFVVFKPELRFEAMMIGVRLQKLFIKGGVIGAVAGSALIALGIGGIIGITKAVQHSKNSKRTETKNGIVNNNLN